MVNGQKTDLRARDLLFEKTLTSPQVTRRQDSPRANLGDRALFVNGHLDASSCIVPKSHDPLAAVLSSLCFRAHPLASWVSPNSTMEQIRNSRNPLNPLIFGNSDKSLSFGLPPHRQTSSAKDPVVEEFFDMELYLEEDTATHSDTSSEERSVAASFNTAPTSVGTAADDEDIVMLDPPLFSPVALTPEVVWPQVPNTGPPREVTISIDALTHTGPSPAPAKDQLDHCSRKTRTVKDTEKTSVVRSLGACTPCKMARVSVRRNAPARYCDMLTRGFSVIKAPCVSGAVSQNGRSTLIRGCGAIDANSTSWLAVRHVSS